MPLYFVLALTMCNGIIMYATRVLLPLYALELGAQPVTVGALAATFAILPMLLAVPAGRFADRFGARGLLMFVASVGGLALLLPYFVPQLPAIFAAAALIGLSTGIFVVSQQNLVGLLSNPGNRVRNFIIYHSAVSIGTFSGPLVAGFSIDRFGHADACLYVALMTLAPIALLALRRDALRGSAQRAAHASGGVRSMLSEPGVRWVLANSSLFSLGVDLYKFYMPVYAHSVGLSASIIGIVLSINAGSEFLVRSVLPRLIARFSDVRVLAYAFCIGGGCLALVPFFKAAVILALISSLFGAAMGCLQPIITFLTFRNSAEGRSGEAMGLRMTANHITSLIGPAVFGAIGSALGLPPMFWINALMLASGGIYGHLRNRDT